VEKEADEGGAVVEVVAVGIVATDAEVVVVAVVVVVEDDDVEADEDGAGATGTIGMESCFKHASKNDLARSRWSCAFEEVEGDKAGEGETSFCLTVFFVVEESGGDDEDAAATE